MMRLIAAVLLAAFFVPTIALAQVVVNAVPATTYVWHWGDWLTAIINWGFPIAVTGFLSLVAAKVPWLQSSLEESQTQARINRAVNYATTQVDGAVAGKVLDIDVGTKVAVTALDYMQTLAPSVAARLGARLKPMILAEIARLGMAPAEPITSPLPTAPVPQTRK